MKKQDKEQELLNELVDAWESLEGDVRHTAKTVERWMMVKMKPAIDDARNFLGRVSKKIDNEVKDVKAKTNRKK